MSSSRKKNKKRPVRRKAMAYAQISFHTFQELGDASVY
jgi:hypothetical protein